jgi:serine/threonine protein kinase
VYSARDTKLGRLVALKVLPQRFSSDPERLARLRREARVLASLNQPNIASIYGLEESDDVQALVLELVEGPTLADRIARGPVPPDEALRLARQIADAFEAAHEMGIIHRDLKPSNIKVRHDGTVKVLDFGLAKALDPVLGRDDETAPTITAPRGTILGTPAYMSPERARGQAADRRDDIWAFGCVLYEMLTGRAVFSGKTISEIVSEVLKSEPDWGRLPPDTPPAIRRLLRRCAQKDRKHRLHDIADARLELDEATSGSQDDFRTVQTATTKRRRERFVFLSVLALATMFATVQSVRLWRQASMLPMAPERRLEINTPGTPEGTLGEPSYPRSLALSPDGLKIVFPVTFEGRSQLWLRSLDSVTSRPLAGTDLAVLPFWSPDSRTVGFFADGRLKRIDIDGGTIQTLANAPFGRGGAWNHDGTILFAPLFSGPIFRIRDTGGEAAALTQLERPQKDHRLPQFLPDGRRFIYHATDPAETSGVYISHLDGSMTSRLLDAEMALIHRDTGQLLFLRQGTLFAQPFDPDGSALTGTPSPMAEKVAAVSVSDAGPIAYRTVGAAAGVRRQFVWLD